MNPTREALLAALVGVGLCVLWNVEHEHTSIRAPWTGLTLGASAAAFIAAGVVGGGWRAVIVCAAVVAGAAVLVEGFFLDSEPVSDEACDPGCISPEAATIGAVVIAAALATLGIAVRRGVAAVWSGGAPAATRRD
jgi:hypothetical protein